jgi:predicted dehydrogenase
MAGGVMFDLGTHLVDQAVCLFGEVQQVYAEADARRAGAKIDDDSFISLRFANGVLAHLSASKVNAEPQARFHIVGTDGTFTKFGLDPQENQLGTGMRPNLEGYGLDSPPSFGSLVTRQGEFGVPILPGDYRKYYELVRQALISGTKPPVDPNDAVYCLAILEAARHSAIDHAVVELAPRSEYLAGNP